MTRSLSARLARSTIAFGAPVLVAFCLTIYLLARHELYQEFDLGLAGRARTLASLVEREHTRWEFEYSREVIPEYASTADPAYFLIVEPDGTEIGRSPTLGDADLPLRTGPMEAPVFENLALPDGRAGRMTGIRFVARLDEDITAEEAPHHRREVWLVVACDTAPLEHGLKEIGLTLLGLGSLALLLLAGASVLAVRRGLRPLAELAARIEAIDARDLSVRIDPRSVSDELAAPIHKLDDLLARLEESFDRERRFTSNVSHELRTPLGALSAILELAGSKERSSSEYRTAIREAHEIVREMTGTVERLLWLSRADAHQLEPRTESVPLAALVDECWRGYAETAGHRRLSFDNRLSGEASVESDRKMLELIVGNLLSNAASYTEEGGWIRVEANEEALIDVIDSGPPIPNEDIPRLFDRFWRGDQSRSGNRTHAGIGLSLAKSLSDLLGLEITAENLAGGAVQFRLRRRDRDSPHLPATDGAVTATPSLVQSHAH
jgi:two-component system, OmpR family, heavy metal sensor histidine kinase CusS